MVRLPRWTEEEESQLVALLGKTFFYWEPEEDEYLLELVPKAPKGSKWTWVQSHIPGRSLGACRNRHAIIASPDVCV